MKLSKTYRTALIAIAGFLLTAALHKGLVAHANSTQGVRNVVIVHGAWADGSSWSKVIPLLQAKGLHVVAVQNPLTSLADDVAATKRAIALQDGPVLLVGHSYGGVVITEVGNDPRVGDEGRVIVDGATVSIGRAARVTPTGDTRFFAGWRSDPFFCDVEGAKNNLQFTGDDFFADQDVCSIVLEVPNSALGTKEVRLWARTLTQGDLGGWIQVERGARPAQAVILVEEREAYLAGEPATDGRFIAGFAHALEHTGGYSPAEAKRVAGTLLPDVLSYDPRRPASFPDNGRTLTDDAFDSFIRILKNGKVTEDKVGPHGDLLAEFPYVGPPHQSRVTKAPNEMTATHNQLAAR